MDGGKVSRGVVPTCTHGQTTHHLNSQGDAGGGGRVDVKRYVANMHVRKGGDWAVKGWVHCFIVVLQQALTSLRQ